MSNYTKFRRIFWMKIPLLLGVIFFVLWAIPVFSQIDTSWVKSYKLPENSADVSRDAVTDDYSNLYMTGQSSGSGSSNDYANIDSWQSACTPGDFNNNGVVSPEDVVFIINYLFLCGSAPPCQPVEANGNCELDWGDCIYLVKYIYFGGPAPVAWCSNPDNYSDPGYPDTIRIGTVSDTAGSIVDVPVYINNDEAIQPVIPLKIDTTKVVCDTVITAGTRGAGKVKGIKRYCGDYRGILLFPDGTNFLEAGSGVVAYLRCRIKSGASPGFVKIDSTYLAPNKLRFFKENTRSIKPIFVSGGIDIIREIPTAISAGLAWLATKQDIVPGPDFGSWGADDKVGKTGLAVKKFEHDAILKGYSSPFEPTYPYHQVVERGIDYLFKNADTVRISRESHGNPDTDGDSIGVTFCSPSGTHPTYETGIALMAIAETNTPDRVVNVPGSPVNGWTYYEVAVDAMNWLAFAQIDEGTQRGSWGYEANEGGDQSNSGYAVLGLGYAEAPAPNGFGISIPQFVRNELGDLGLWIDYVQDDVDGDEYDGGSGYNAPDYYPNILETGNLLFEMAWYGDNLGIQRVQDAVDYIVRHWTDPGYSWPGPQGWHGNYQAMFTLMKGLEAFGITLIDTIDWFDEVSDSILATQHANGSWGPDYWDYVAGNDTILSTTWALLALQKATPPPREVDCENSLSDSGLVLCPSGDVPFNVFLRDSANNPLVSYSNVWLDFSGCSGIIPCPNQNLWPIVYPAAPSDDSGKVTFYVSASGCNLSCLIPVKAKCGTIASIPIRTLDNSGDLKVSYEDFDDSHGLCRDYNFNDSLDYNDLSFFNEHKRHGCTTGPPSFCELFRKYLVVDPDTNLPVGKTTKVTLFIQNNFTTDCSIDSIKFYYSGFGALDTLKQFAFIMVGFNLSPGDSLSLGADYLWHDTSAAVFYARIYTDCCSSYIQVERNINRVRQCPPSAMDFKFGWNVGFSPIYTDTLPFMPSGWSYSINYPVLPDSGVIIRTSNLSPLGTKGSLSLAAYTDPGRTNFVAERTFEVFVTMRSGDANGDCKVTVSDVVYIINYLFKGGPAPKPLKVADTNCDGKVTVSDVVYLINYLFKGGPPSPCSE